MFVMMYSWLQYSTKSVQYQILEKVKDVIALQMKNKVRWTVNNNKKNI